MSNDMRLTQRSVEDADVFARAVELLLDKRDDEARSELLGLARVDPITAPIYTLERSSSLSFVREVRKGVPMKTKANIYVADGWRCRYCGRKVIVPGILELLTDVLPGFKGLLPGHHMRIKLTELAVNRVYPNVDHVRAIANGGSLLDSGNLITACTPCNEKKSNGSGWQPRPSVNDKWDGLVGSYRGLSDRVDNLRGYHRRWFSALGI